MYYLSLDVGTSGLKTTVMDEAEALVYEGHQAYHYDQPQEGYRQIEPNVWKEAALKGIEDVFRKYPKASFRAIGLTGQMHTAVFLDREGQPVRPAILWNDLRTAKMVDKVKEYCAKYPETKYIEKILSIGAPAMNILWVKENEPELFKRIAHILTPYDYLGYVLTGQYSCDYCDASTSSMYDIVNKEWARPMLDLIGLDPSVFPPIHSGSDIIGTLKPGWVERFGLQEALPVTAGSGDNPCTALAMGVIHRSSPVISLGTSGVVIYPKKDKDFDGVGKNVLFSPEKGSLVNVVQATVQSAGGTHLWWVRNIVQSQDLAVDQDQLSLESLEKGSLLFYPHIAGDKSLYADPSLRGAFFGLSGNTTRKDMTQAVFEGIAFAFRELLEKMNLPQWPKIIEMNGGGTKSRIWMEIFANILHTDIEVVTDTATPGYGACCLAKLADGKELILAREPGKVYTPQPSLVAHYHKQYRRYLKIHSLIKELDTA